MNLDNEAMKTVMAKAVLDSMTDDARDELITKAITDYVSKSDKGNYGSNKTPLEEAFEFATRDIARGVIKEKLEDDAFKEPLEKAISEALKKAFNSENKGKLIDNMADAVVAAFRVEDRY